MEQEKSKLDLEKIVKEFTPYLSSVINHMVQENLTIEDKEEIITDTFFILWKKQEEVNNMKSYMAGITRHLVLEKLKKRKIEYDISDYENVIEFASQELFLEDRSEIEKVEKKIGKLNEVDYEIITLFYYSEKTVKEIAEQLHLSETNVKVKLHRIRQKIKREIGGEREMEEKIMSRLKMKIAIDEIKQERKSYQTMKKRIGIVAVFCMVMITGFTMAKEVEKIVQVFFTNSSKAIDMAANNGYIQNIEMDYVYDKDIGIKIENIVLDKDNLAISLYYKLAENNVKEVRIQKYDIVTGDGYPIHSSESVYETIPLAQSVSWGDHTQIELLENMYQDSVLLGLRNLEKTIDEIVFHIQCMRITYHDGTIKDIEGEWNIQIKVSDDMKKSNTIKYTMQGTNEKVKSCIAVASPTGVRIELKLNEPVDLMEWIDKNMIGPTERNELEDFNKAPFSIIKDGEKLLPVIWGGADGPIEEEEIGKIHVIQYNDIGIFDNLDELELYIEPFDMTVFLVREK